MLTENDGASPQHPRPPAVRQRNSALKTDRTARMIIGGHAFIQSLRRGHYELGTGARQHQVIIAAAFDELAATI